MTKLAEPASIIEAAQAICRGNLVVMPTETVYGLAADASNHDAVLSVFAAKGRPSENPLIVHVASIEQAKQAVEWSESAQLLAESFWPGPLTIVLPKPDGVVDSSVSGGLNSLAIRMPNHPVALALIEASQRFICAPSANRFMHLSATRVADLDEEIVTQAQLVLDAGPCPIGLESTVISLLDDHPVVLRQGAITTDNLSRVLGITIKYHENHGGHQSPGRYARHYAPDVPTKVVQVAKSPFALLYSSPKQFDSQLQMPLEPHLYAATLYAALHQLERANPPLIEIEAPLRGEGWEAVWERLKKASS